MTANATCSACGARLSAGAAEGVCARCLIGAVLTPAPSPVNDGEAELGAASSLLGQRQFGGYELLEEIARGGMGVVFRARQRKPERLVALKVIAAGELASPKLIERFRAETEAAASLDHPNIVSIYEVGEQSGFHFFSMRLVEGQTLGATLAGKPMEPRRAAELLAAVARAVHYAHQRGILHRDLKPSNILLDAQGKPHLTDFGLAKLLERDTDLTLSGAVLGTPSYMAPEQAAGRTKQLTTAADVYGLGAVFFEMLTGRPPFAGDSSLATVRQVVDADPPRPSALNAKVPADLETICLKCLEKKPVQRYGSAEALADDLGRWLRHEPIQARPGTPLEHAIKWFRRNPTRAGLYFTLLISFVGAWIGSMVVSFRLAAARNLAEHHRGEAEQSAETSRQRLVQLNIQTGERLLQDMDSFGAQLWFLEALRLDRGNASRETPHRYLLESARRQSPRLTHLWFQASWIQGLAFNPQGDRVVILDSTGLTVRDVATGRQTMSLPAGVPYGITWMIFTHDGTRLITGNSDGTARICDAATGQAVGGPMLQQAERHCHVVLSPDGRTLLTFGGSEAARTWDIATGEFTGRAFAHGDKITSASYSKDGQRLLTMGADKLARIWNTATATEIGKPMKHDYHLDQGMFSPDGSRVVTSQGVYGILHVWDAETGEALFPPIKLGGGVMRSEFILDGPRVATVLYYGEMSGAIWDVRTGQVVHRFQGADYDGRYILCSRDGTRVVTTSWDKTVRLRDSATGEYAGPLLRHSSAPSALSLSPDGHYLAVGDEMGVVRLWDLAAMKGAVTQLLKDVEVLHVEYSTDGRKIVAACGDGVARVFDAESAKAIGSGFVHPHGLKEATFSKDGQFIATVDARETVRVWKLASEAEPIQSFVHPTNVSSSIFSPDGRRVATAGLDGRTRVWDVRTGSEVFAPLEHTSSRQGSHRLAFTADGQRLITGGSEGNLLVWDAGKGERLWKVKLNGQVKHIAISPDGRRIVAAINDPRFTPLAAHVFDIESGRPVGAPLRHGDGVMSAEFSPDGKFIVTAGEDRATRVWETETGNLVTQVRRHTHWVGSASFSPDGRHVVSSSNDRTALVWEAASGQVISLPLRHEAGVTRALFSPDGHRVLTAARDGLRLWDLQRTDAPFEDLMEEVQVTASLRLDPRFGFVPLDLSALSNGWRQIELRRQSVR